MENQQYLEFSHLNPSTYIKAFCSQMIDIYAHLQLIAQPILLRKSIMWVEPNHQDRRTRIQPKFHFLGLQKNFLLNCQQ